MRVEILEMALERLLPYFILDEIEDQDAHAKFPRGIKTYQQMMKRIMKNTEDRTQLLVNLSEMVGAIGQAWGHDVFIVFHHMGLESDEDKSKALFYLVMGCLGHGIGLADDYSEQLKKSEAILGRLTPKKFEEAPVSFDQHCTFTDVFDHHFIYPKEQEAVTNE